MNLIFKATQKAHKPFSIWFLNNHLILLLFPISLYTPTNLNFFICFINFKQKIKNNKKQWRTTADSKNNIDCWLAMAMASNKSKNKEKNMRHNNVMRNKQQKKKKSDSAKEFLLCFSFINFKLKHFCSFCRFPLYFQW